MILYPPGQSLTKCTVEPSGNSHPSSLKPFLLGEGGENAGTTFHVIFESIKVIFMMIFADFEALGKESQIPVWRPELWSTCDPTQRTSEQKGN